MFYTHSPIVLVNLKQKIDFQTISYYHLFFYNGSLEHLATN